MAYVGVALKRNWVYSGLRDIFFLKVFLFIVVAVMGMTATITAEAQVSKYTETVKAEFLYQSMVGDNTKPTFYATPGEVWDVFMAFHNKACAEQANLPIKYACGTYGPPHPCTNADGIYGVNYVWGQADIWCYSYTYPSDDGPYSGVSTFATILTVCQDGYYSSGYIPVPGATRSYEVYCYKTKPSVKPCECGHGNPIYPSAQAKRQFEFDYFAGNSPLSFTRIYDSATGLFRSSFDIDFLPPVAKFQADVCVKSPVTITDPIAGTVRFDKCFVSLNYDGTHATFTGTDGARREFVQAGSGWSPSQNYVNDRLASVSVGGVNYWMLSRRDEGTVLLFDSSGHIVRQQSIAGPSVWVTYSSATGLQNGLKDDFGRLLTVNKSVDVDGHPVLGSIVDPAGQTISFGYNSQGQMNQVTYQDATGKAYLWDEPTLSTGSYPGLNRLTGVQDESHVRYAKFGYLNGAAISTEHAVGVEKYSLVDSRDPSTGAGNIVMTYPSGASYTMTYAVINGLSVETANNQPAGSGSTAATSSIQYDGNGNISAKVDLNGHQTCYENDLTTNLEQTRVEGLSSSAACGNYTGSNATAAVPVGARRISTKWHPEWRLATKVAEPGRLTTSVYNGQPDPFNANAIASCAPAAATLPDGKPIAVLCKQVEQATTDADGHLGFSATLQSGVPNRVYQWTYNQYGQVLTAKGPRTDINDTTTYAYYSDTTADHTLGDLKSVTNALNQVTQYTKYNPHGQVLQMVDANNVTTDYQYDLRQRLKSVSTAGQATTYDYWPTGLLKQINLPDASYIKYTYDDAHRLTDIADNLGNSVHYTLDNSGNRTKEEVKDPSSALKRWLQRVPDALGRVQQTNGRE